jgi:hypothetical protein
LEIAGLPREFHRQAGFFIERLKDQKNESLGGPELLSQPRRAKP